MNLNLLYFSPTGTTEKILESVSGAMDYPVKNTYDLTRSENREKHITFSDEDIVIVGVPVYAGRIPQILLPSLKKSKERPRRQYSSFYMATEIMMMPCLNSKTALRSVDL